MNINLQVTKHFKEFLMDWDYREYFLLGGFGSGKSYTIVQKIILKCLKEKRTVLVVRQVFSTIRDSTFSLFREILRNMGLQHIVIMTVSPMKIVFPNGSEVLFRGLDRPDKLRSINNVSIIFVEEASEISYEGYKELQGRARNPDKSIHFILATNPAPRNNWVYRHFFENRELGVIHLCEYELYDNRIMTSENRYYHHSTVDDNPFLPDSYTEQLDDMKNYDPDLYKTARLGRFGTTGVKVLPQLEIMKHDEVMDIVSNIPSGYKRIGMDFGFEVSYNAVVRVAIDDERKYLYVYYEYYKNKMTDDKTVVELDEFRRTGELIRADSAEPKTIQYFNQEGFRMIGAKKGPGSRLQNTKKMKRFRKIIVSDKCIQAKQELDNLTFAVDRNGIIIEDEFNVDAHIFEAMWYALDGYEVADIKARKNLSGKGAR